MTGVNTNFAQGATQGVNAQPVSAGPLDPKLLEDLIVAAAFLAVVFLFTVHFFNNHFRPDKFPLEIVMFTGSMSLEHYQREHPLEYQRMVESGAGGVVFTPNVDHVVQVEKNLAFRAAYETVGLSLVDGYSSRSTQRASAVARSARRRLRLGHTPRLPEDGRHPDRSRAGRSRCVRRPRRTA